MFILIFFILLQFVYFQKSLFKTEHVTVFMTSMSKIFSFQNYGQKKNVSFEFDAIRDESKALRFLYNKCFEMYDGRVIMPAHDVRSRICCYNISIWNFQPCYSLAELCLTWKRVRDDGAPFLTDPISVSGSPQIKDCHWDRFLFAAAWRFYFRYFQNCSCQSEKNVMRRTVEYLREHTSSLYFLLSKSIRYFLFLSSRSGTSYFPNSFKKSFSSFSSSFHSASLSFFYSY